jgi:hypothetical protein
LICLLCGFPTPEASLTAKLCMMTPAGLSGQQLQFCQGHRHVARVVQARLSKHALPNQLSSVNVSCSSSSSDQIQKADKLFSNLNPRTLKHEPGSVWGSALLVSGTTIGAGKQS